MLRGMMELKPKEKEFCRLMTVYADPIRAAREAGYKHPEQTWATLSAREEIVNEIHRRCENIRSIYESTAVCGLYRLVYGDVGDSLTLLYRETIGEEELRALDLRNVSEIKRTDKGMEIKFCDRIKALEKLKELSAAGGSRSVGAGLLDAILSSAEALKSRCGSEYDVL